VTSSVGAREDGVSTSKTKYAPSRGRETLGDRDPVDVIYKQTETQFEATHEGDLSRLKSNILEYEPATHARRLNLWGRLSRRRLRRESARRVACARYLRATFTAERIHSHGARKWAPRFGTRSPHGGWVKEGAGERPREF
jgi:hypothetical protein